MGRWWTGRGAAAVLALVVAGCAAPRTSPSDGAAPDLELADDLAVAPDDLARPPDLAPPCIEGLSCNSGNPGACGPGRTVCSPAPGCAPLVTQQACYDGPAGTLGKGVCKGGMQSCVGSLGPCMGEVVPAAREGCFNDTDDDCDGVVNDGCPDHLELGAPRALPSHGGIGGGGPYQIRCPANSFVLRAQMWFDYNSMHASGVTIFCATPQLTRGASSYTVTPVSVLPSPYGTLTGSSATQYGDVNCGTGGLTAGWGASGGADSSYVTGIGLDCADGAVAFDPNTDQLSVSFTPNTTGTYWSYGGTLFNDTCQANEVFIGWDLRVGGWMDQLTGVCAPIVVKYK